MHEVEFELDEFLIQEILSGNVVVFAGAGVSTENIQSTPHTLYVGLERELGLTKSDLPFPDLAERFAQQPDGQFKLLRKIQEHFDYVYKFGDLRRSATGFSRELSTMPYLDTFITTNWDRNFEENCAAKPFVYEADMRFWDVATRRVLKIHGTIDDYSSIIATRSDYQKCEERLHRSLIGAKLKEILSLKTCIFVGYSMKDDDFREIFSFVKNLQGKFEKSHYFVSPRANEHDEFSALIKVPTDGRYFFEVIKEHLCAKYEFLPDQIYDYVADELNDVRDEHIRFVEDYNVKIWPQSLLSAAYQDGLIHGYEMILDSRKNGRFSDLSAIDRIVRGYDEKQRDYINKKFYVDVAYFRGYQNAFISVGNFYAQEEFFPAPICYHQKVGEMTREEYDDRCPDLPDVHKAAYKYCKALVARLPDDHLFQHMPWG